MVAPLPDLHELDFPPEVVDDFLEALMVPPLDGEVHLAARDDQPVRTYIIVVMARGKRIESSLLFGSKMNVALEKRRFDLQIQFLVKKLNEAVNEVMRLFVARVDKWILAGNFLRFRIVVCDRRDVRVVNPKIRTRRPNVRKK